MNSLLNYFVDSAYAAENIKVNNDTSIEAVLIKIADNYIIPIAGMIAVAAIVYAGVLYIVSQGEPEKVSKAKRALTYAVVGVILFILAYAIVKYLGRLPKTL